MDKLSVQRIELLNPLVRESALAVLSEIDERLTSRAKVRITYTLRTYKEQQDLYNLGRTVVNPDGKSKSKPKGNIVTNAQAWQSIHNYGLAFDIALIIDGKTASWDTVKDWDQDGVSDWIECVAVAKKHGWEWGGDWKTFKDMPHFQKDFGYSWQKLQDLRNRGRFIPGTEYVDVSTMSALPINIYRVTTTLNFRKGPGTGYGVIQLLGKGETVQVIGRNGTWYEILYKGIRGFVSSQYLIKT